MDDGRAQWRSLLTYVLVTTGAVVGLGNIFGFPIYLIQYGSLFLYLYLLCEILIAVPLLFSELMIGRRGRQNPVGSISIIAMEEHASSRWRYIGWLCFIILVLSLPLYISSVAFPVDYFFHFIRMIFSSYNITLPITPLDTFVELEICFILFLAATFAVITRGINKGLETISCLLVPTYLIILLILAVYISATIGFLPSLSNLVNGSSLQPFLVILSTALLYAFFKLNIGMGSMIVYGSYLPYRVSLARSTLIVIGLDAVVSLASYFIIYPLMLTSQLGNVKAENTDIIFISLAGHSFIATAFYFVSIIAAWLPTIAMAEAATVTLIERFHLSRIIASLSVTIIALIIGSLLLFSRTQWTGIFSIQPGSFTTMINAIVSLLLTPLTALLIAVFIGWIVSNTVTRSELEFKPFLYQIWLSLVRYVVPISLIMMILLLFK